MSVQCAHILQKHSGSRNPVDRLRNKTITRSKQQDAAERNFAFVEKRQMLATIPAGLRAQIEYLLLPRHDRRGAGDRRDTGRVRPAADDLVRAVKNLAAFRHA